MGNKQKAEQKEAKRMKSEERAQEQLDLKEKWGDQEKDNTLKRKEKLEQEAKRVKEEHDNRKKSKEEELKRKSEEKEILREKRKKSLDRQNELKKRWSEYEEDDDFCKTAQKQEAKDKKPKTEEKMI